MPSGSEQLFRAHRYLVQAAQEECDQLLREGRELLERAAVPELWPDQHPSIVSVGIEYQIWRKIEALRKLCALNSEALAWAHARLATLEQQNPPELRWPLELSDEMAAAVMGQLGPQAGKAAAVCMLFWKSVCRADQLQMFRRQILCAAITSQAALVCTPQAMFSFDLVSHRVKSESISGGTRIRAIAAGTSILLLADDGNLFVRSGSTLCRVDGVTGVRGVAAGDDHGVAFTESGLLYFIRLDSSPEQPIAVRCCAHWSTNVVAIGSQGKHTVVGTATGNVYCCHWDKHHATVHPPSQLIGSASNWPRGVQISDVALAGCEPGGRQTVAPSVFVCLSDGRVYHKQNQHIGIGMPWNEFGLSDKWNLVRFAVAGGCTAETMPRIVRVCGGPNATWLASKDCKVFTCQASARNEDVCATTHDPFLSKSKEDAVYKGFHGSDNFDQYVLWSDRCVSMSSVKSARIVAHSPMQHSMRQIPSYVFAI